MKIYDSFIMRLHRDNPASEWGVDEDSRALSVFGVGDVQIPHPIPKTKNEDVPGANGVYDLTEAGGRVFYQNRTITVPLVLRADRHWTHDIDVALARYNGRLCDFAFNPTFDAQNNRYSPEWIYTGRLTVTKDRFSNVPVTLTFDAEPFATATDYTILDVPVSQDVERTEFAWAFDTAIYGNLTYYNISGGLFLLSVDNIGTTLFYKRSNLTPGDHYALGIKSIIGGSMAFYGAGNADNLTEGVVDENGTLTVKITIDGSYYTWRTVNDVVSSYPSFRVEFILAKLPTGSSTTLSSNCVIRPEIANLTAAAYLIMDGSVFEINDTNNQILKPFGAILPGVRADKSEPTTTSIFVCVPKTTGTPEMTIGFHKQEAF